MRWYKHVTNSHNDEKLAEILHEFGLEGYGFWWLLCEIIGKEMDNSDRCHLSYPLAAWARKLHCSKRKTSMFFQKFSEISLVFLDFSAENEKSCIGKLTVKIPNLLKYRDEYSKKSGQTPDKLPKDSGAKKEIEKEIEKKLQRLSPEQVKDEYLKYAGVIQLAGGQMTIIKDIAETFPADIIIESFQAGNAGGKRGAGYLNWCLARMRGKSEDVKAAAQEPKTGGFSPVTPQESAQLRKVMEAYDY